MRGLRKWAWAVLAAAAAATPAAAQTTSSSSSFSGSTGASGAANTASTGNSMGSSGGGNGLGGSQQNGTSLQTMQSAPSLTAPTGSASSSLSSSNSFSGYYANPYYQGLISASVNATPGGFGTALYGTSTNSGANGTGSVNRGSGNNQNSTQISGILIPIQAQINYTAQAQFATAPVPGARLQADLREAIDGSVSNSKGVQVITDANNNVTLRGSVKDDDESRLVEGLVRITPGVRAITNQLTVSPSPGGVTAAGR